MQPDQMQPSMLRQMSNSAGGYQIMLEQAIIQQQLSQHGTLAAVGGGVPNLVSMNMNMNMNCKNFPVFKIKYTPKSRCKLHKIIQEKTAEKERAALISLSD